MSGKPLHITLNHIAVYLLPERALYIPAYRLLVIADWHLGKIQHFRKNGIFIPRGAIGSELQQLTVLTEHYPVNEVLFLGDLFHSTSNSDWDALLAYLRQSPLTFTLVKGNHDLIDFENEGSADLAVCDRWLLDDRIIFTHEPLIDIPGTAVNIAGHIHPGYTIRGKGRQRYRLPCFYQEGRKFILPAFGKYTGLHTMRPANGAAVYPIVGDEVLRLTPSQREAD